MDNYYEKFKKIPLNTRIISGALIIIFIIVIILAYVNFRAINSLGSQINSLDKKIDTVDSKFGRALSDSPTYQTDHSAIDNSVMMATVLIVNRNAVARLQQNLAGSYADLTFLGEGYGTGFFINPNGYIATATHVIETIASTSDLTVMTIDGNFHPAKIIRESKNSDIAILKIEGHVYPSVDLGYQDNVSIGDKVGIVGYGAGLNVPLVHTGTISGRTASGIGAQVYVNAFVNRGNSGGPIFSLDTGKVIAIVGARKNEPIPQGQVVLPPNYGSGMNIGGLDPVLLTVDLYNKMVENISITSQFGDGIGYSVDTLRDLASGIHP